MRQIVIPLLVLGLGGCDASGDDARVEPLRDAGARDTQGPEVVADGGESGRDAAGSEDSAVESDAESAGDTEDTQSDAEAAGDSALTDLIDDDGLEHDAVPPEDARVELDGAVDADAAVDGASDGALIEPSFECRPTVSACDAPAAPERIVASYRKDAWLESYSEYGDPPLNGGRFHIAGTSAVTGRVTRVLINGIDAASILVENAPGEPAFEWFHYWPSRPVAGEPFWVQFHSRDSAWDSRDRATIVVETDAGEALRGEFAVEQASVPLTYVTTTADLSTLLVFARNDSGSPRTVEYLYVNGRDVTSTACFDPIIGPGDTALIEVPLCTPAQLGGAFTVELGLDDATHAVGVGRVVRPHFVVEGWNNTVECPFPGGIESNHVAMLDARFDTQYVHSGVCGACGCDTRNLLETILPASGMRALVTSDVGLSGSPLTVLDGIAGWATGDESDGEFYDEETGVPVAALKADESQRLWERYPTLPTFNGAKTNRRIGTFAGMADIQGIDLYIAACAPHITPFGQHPPITGAYDYLRNARDNHMPLTTWMYAQGLSPVWNKTVPLIGTPVHVQPDPQEILVQAFAVLAAGGKGLMWFQTNQEEADHNPARWQAIASANRMIGAVRELVRSGDLTSDATAIEGVLVESIRSSRAIVVPVINHLHTAEPDDISCLRANISESSVPRWVLDDVETNINIAVARDFGVVDVFEVTASAIVDADYRVSERTLTLPNIGLSNRVPVRLFVLARDEELRAEIEAGF
jgi:hypothetical protein